MFFFLVFPYAYRNSFIFFRVGSVAETRHLSEPY